MEITVLINAHGHPDVVADTVASINHYLTPQVYVVADGGNLGAFHGFPAAPLIPGLVHLHHKAPYRNMLLGMSMVADLHPATDWLIYMDYDCLVASKGLRNDLARWDAEGVWLFGADHRRDQKCDLSFAEAVLKTPLPTKQYLLGAMMGFHKTFLARLREMDFWNRMLTRTNDFQQGFFPNYKDWDVSEHLYPSVAASLGGRVIGVSAYDVPVRLWRGNFQRYPVRWQPEIAPDEVLPPASVIHPVKSMDNPIRVYARMRRRHEVGIAGAAPTGTAAQPDRPARPEQGQAADAG